MRVLRSCRLDLSKLVIGAWRLSCASEANALWPRRVSGREQRSHRCRALVLGV